MRPTAAMVGEARPEIREDLWQSLQAAWPELVRAAIRPAVRYRQWLTVPHAGEIRVVAVADILYVQADNKYTTIVTHSSTFLLNLSLKEMQRRLDPENFWRIHRGTIVNVGAIDIVYRSFRGSMEIKLKQREELLPVSAAHAHQFKHL